LHAPPPKLSRAAPDLPAALEAVISKALSKSPLDRYATCGELIAAARAAAAERRVHRLRLAASIALLVLAGLVGSAIALGTLLALRDAPAPRVETVLQKPPPAPASLDTLLLQSKDARTLNDAAYWLIRGGQYERAVPFAQKAVRHAGRGDVVRGYATFNLGLALLKTGRCGEALPYLTTALRIEAPEQRPFIRPRIKQAKKCVQRGAAAQAQSP
jgi:tetratricopeptide (TPR) repeat protein